MMSISCHTGFLGPTAVHRPFSNRRSASSTSNVRAKPQRVVRSVVTQAGLPVESTDAVVEASNAASSLIAEQQLSPAIIAAGLAAAGLVGGALLWSQRQSAADPETAAGGFMDSPPPPPKQAKDAVLVFGASGKLGRLLVKSLLNEGRTVVAALRDDAKVGTLSEAAAGFGDRLFFRSGVDITNPATLTLELLDGVAQIAIAVGPIFGRTSEGQMGYLDNMTSERVDSEGVANIANFAKQLPETQADSKLLLSMATQDDLEVWQRLDDVIMGGKSDSALAVAAEDSDASAVWRGELITEGGGFCGARTASQDWDLGSYDGILLRVRGDGQTYKMNLKTAEQEDSPESTYQAQFDTEEGVWKSVRLPWHAFVPVKRAQVDRSKHVVAAAEVRQFGLVLSRFEYNGFANPNCRPGPFQLELQDGIRAYRATKPALVLVGTAAVERNAVIGDDEAARKADIPIVQLNPGGVLNYKYAGEAAVRAAGVPYTVVRSVGLTSEDLDTSFLLETKQGDAISGKISRDEVAKVVAEALSTPFTTGKTFEVRRSEAADGRGKSMTPADFRRSFLQLTEDRLRPEVGLWPFPKVVPPPPPPSEERKQEILSDDRVKDAMAKGRGGRVRDEAETDAAGSMAPNSDGRSEVSSPSAEVRDQGQQSAEQWISNWRGRDTTTETAADATSARDWIDNWKQRTS